MLRSASLVAITGFWITMMSLLIHREFFELARFNTPQEVLAIDFMDMREEYRAIYLGQQRIGFSQFALEPLKNEKDAYELRHTTYLSFLFLGHEREMLVKGRARLDDQLHLHSFELRVKSGDSWTQMKGEITGPKMLLEIKGSGSRPVQKIIPVEGPVMHSESLGFLWTPGNLRLGKRGKIKIWNPMQMSFQDIEFSIQEKQKIEFQGKEHETYVTHWNLGGIETRVWISTEGVILKEESPSGLLLQKEDAYVILDGLRKSRSALPDLPNLFSIPSNKIIDPEKIHYMKVSIKAPDSEKVYEIREPDLRAVKDISLPVTQEELKPYLESDSWIQAADPDILAQSRQIVGDEKNALAASLKIMSWVHENVSPIPSVNLPVSRDVLRMRKGDCNEYTVLFTALARAAGIPAKMVAGLAYLNGRFFYHAWPEIYAGEWIALDPTFGQAPADAAHIPLASGGLQEQIDLVSKVGRIKVIILETK